MKGEITIEVCDNQDNLKYTIKKKNKVTDYYKKYPFIFQQFKAVRGLGLHFAIPNSSWTSPLIDTEGDFTFNQDMTSISNAATKTHTEEENYWSDDGKRVFQCKSNGYFQGPIDIFGIIMYVYMVSDRGTYPFFKIFSALDMDPVLNITENERVYLNYKFIMEW